jgi:hypothetical protein
VAGSGSKDAEQDIKEDRLKSVCNGACGIEGCCGTVKRHGCIDRWCSDRWHLFSCEEMQNQMKKVTGILHMSTQCRYHREVTSGYNAVKSAFISELTSEVLLCSRDKYVCFQHLSS